jgi:hypothetical protein
MQKQSFFSALLVLFIASTLFTACRKGIEGPDGGTLADFVAPRINATAQNTLTTVQDMIYEVASTSPALNTVSGSLVIGQCPVVTVTPKTATDSFPATLTIDFGNGCTWRGHNMSGKVVLEVSGKVSAGNATMNGSFEQLSVDGNTLSGKINVTTGAAGQSLRNMTFSFTDGKVTTAEGKSVLIASVVATRTQVEGQLTTVSTGGLIAFQDDVFEISFSGNGTGSDGDAFTLSTPTALRRSMTCRWIATGKVEIKSGIKTASIDFGTGTCDDEAIITVAGEVKTVKLP